jgi:hypothetical protein
VDLQALEIYTIHHRKKNTLNLCDRRSVSGKRIGYHSRLRSPSMINAFRYCRVVTPIGSYGEYMLW